MYLPTSFIQSLTTEFPSVTGVSQPITVRSLASFCYAVAWGWLLLVSFTGWGRLSGRLIGVPRLPASIACTLGMAAVIFIGGVLNLFQALYASVLIALVGIGLLLYAYYRKSRPTAYSWKAFWKSAPAWARVLLLAALVILAFRAAATVRLATFNVIDDGPAYLAFPHKLLAMHSFAADPFSDRRIISSLGGAHLLQAFVIAATSLTHIAMADRTLGLILLGGVLFDFGIAFGLSAIQIALLEFLAFLVPQETLNLTFIMLPTSLLLGMMWMIFESSEASTEVRWRYAFLAGAIGGAVISLKSTFLPCVGFFCLVPYLVMYWRKDRAAALRLPLLSGLGALGVLVAWMMAMKASSGTYLFPVLGHGVDYSSYGLFHAAPRFRATRSVIKIFLQAIALMVLMAAQVFGRTWDRKARFAFGILIAAALGITAFNYVSGGDFMWRYNFPQFFAAVIVFFGASAAAYAATPLVLKRRNIYAIAIAALIACIFYYDAGGRGARPFRQVQMEASDYPSALRASLSGLPIASRDTVARYRAVDAAVDSRGNAVEDTAYPFELDYSRNRVMLLDWPGAAGPTPGWPVGREPRTLVQYLSQHSIRYVIYDYDYTVWRDVRICSVFHDITGWSQADLQLMSLAIVTHNQLNHLQQDYKSIYNDGTIAVIDLESPLAHPPPQEPVWTLSTTREAMCSVIVSSWRARHPEASAH